MSYQYSEHREKLFTEEGQREFLAIRDAVADKLDYSGAVMIEKVLTGDSWFVLACFDRLVEIEELEELSTLGGCHAQHRVFIRRGK